MHKNQLFHSSLEELHYMRNCDRDTLLSEAMQNQHAISSNERVYYDHHQDDSWIEHYYCTIEIDKRPPKELLCQLRELVTTTHKYQYPYHMSKGQFLYTWVDLQPNGKLKGLYSGVEKHPSKAMEEDYEIIKKRFLSYQNILQSHQPPKKLQKKMINISRRYKFNTEHVVPQSWFKAKEPMKGDLHHLFACEPECNETRSNFPYFDYSRKELQPMKNRCGSYDFHRFDPQFGKGPAARATLYFLLRYPTKIIKKYRKNIDLDLLESWHVHFPVTRHEKHRNKAIFEIQGNRNPFIDFPERMTSIISILDQS